MCFDRVGIKQIKTEYIHLGFQIPHFRPSKAFDLNALLKERSRGSTSAASAARATETVPNTGGAMAEKSIGA